MPIIASFVSKSKKFFTSYNVLMDPKRRHSRSDLFQGLDSYRGTF